MHDEVPTDTQIRAIAAEARCRRLLLRQKRDRIQAAMDTLEAREYEVLDEIARRITAGAAERGL